MLDLVKMTLRISTGEYDALILQYIAAALADLHIVGITQDDEADPLIIQAVQLYCALQFNTTSDEYDRLHSAYEALKGQLWQASGYTEFVEEAGA